MSGYFPELTLAAAVVIAVVIGWHALLRTHRERSATAGLPRRIVRWHLGHHWSGQAITDAGWHRPGRRALTATGHARRFWYRPQKHRMMIRVAETEGPLLAAWGMVFYPLPTLVVLGGCVLAAIGFAGLRICRAVHRRRHRRNWLMPLHKTLSPMLNIPLANKPETYLQVARDRSSASVALPVAYRSQKEMARLEAAVSDTLGIEAPEVTWDKSGAKPVVTFSKAITPPKVTLDDVRAALEQAGADDIVVGLGKRHVPVTASLHGDSPHLGLSMGSGAGKSGTARFIGAQVMHKGGITLWLDVKRISHPWVSKGRLPNAAYAKTPEQIHRALVWLGAELDRRNDVADTAVDIEGTVHADVGPRLLVVLEELNLLEPKLQAYWRDHGGAGPSPALEALAAVSAAGRQVRINLLLIGQRLSAKVTGGGDSRENIGIRIMGRYTEPTWKMLAGEFPMPPPDDTPGRVQVVTSRVTEAQVAWLTGAEAVALATNRTLTPCPAGMPGICGLPDPGVTEPLPELPPAQTPLMSPGSPPAGVIAPDDGVSLAEACDLEILPVKLPTAKVWRRRYPEFPRPVGLDGLTHLYDPEQLHQFALSRRK